MGKVRQVNGDNGFMQHVRLWREGGLPGMERQYAISQKVMAALCQCDASTYGRYEKNGFGGDLSLFARMATLTEYPVEALMEMKGIPDYSNLRVLRDLVAAKFGDDVLEGALEEARGAIRKGSGAG